MTKTSRTRGTSYHPALFAWSGLISLLEWNHVPNTKCCAACMVIFLAGEEGEARLTCAVCSAREELWVCLACGYCGCGRYARAHAKDHAFLDDRCHRFALEIGTGRIWDYVGDVFVHRRLVQSRHGHDEVALEKTEETDYLAMELDVVLKTQLDSQRQLCVS